MYICIYSWAVFLVCESQHLLFASVWSNLCVSLALHWLFLRICALLCSSCFSCFRAQWERCSKRVSSFFQRLAMQTVAASAPYCTSLSEGTSWTPLYVSETHALMPICRLCTMTCSCWNCSQTVRTLQLHRSSSHKRLVLGTCHEIPTWPKTEQGRLKSLAEPWLIAVRIVKIDENCKRFGHQAAMSSKYLSEL